MTIKISHRFWGFILRIDNGNALKTKAVSYNCFKIHKLKRKDMEFKTHWKKLTNPNYIGAYTLMDGEANKDLIVSIKSVAIEVVKGENGKEDKCMVAQLHGQKPFIINKTNAKMLAKLFESEYIEDWPNKPFILYVAKVKVGSDTVDALRIRPELPIKKALPELNEAHTKWPGAVTALKAGNTTIEAIRAKYTLSQENEGKLLAQTKTEAA